MNTSYMAKRPTSHDIPRGYKGFVINPFSIFKVQPVREDFIKYLVSANNLEPYEFVELVDTLPHELNEFGIIQFSSIVELYIIKGSEREINIPGTVRAPLLEILKEYKTSGKWTMQQTPKTLLQTARQVCVTDLFACFQDYKNTDEAYSVICSLSWNENVISRNPASIIVEKIMDSFNAEKSVAGTIDIATLSQNLASTKFLRTSYLSYDYKDTERLENEMRRMLKVDAVEHEIFLSSQMYKQHNLLNEFKVKLLVIQKKRERKGYGVLNFLSPILSWLVPDMTSGDYETALMIGPFMFQFDESSLCIPKRFTSYSSIALCADLDDVVQIKNVDDVLNTISERVVHWNTKKYYRASSVKKTDNELCGNSQDFIEDLLHSIGIKMEFDTHMHYFLQTMSKEGSAKLEMLIDLDFQSKFNLKQSTQLFKTHDELDDFMIYIKAMDPEFRTNHPSEYQILKSFDRTFWLKYLHLVDFHIDKKKKQLQYGVESLEYQMIEDDIIRIKSTLRGCIHHEKGCPFKDPTATGSFLVPRASSDRRVSRIHRNTMVPIQTKKKDVFSRSSLPSDDVFDLDSIILKVIFVCENMGMGTDHAIDKMSDEEQTMLIQGFHSMEKKLEPLYHKMKREIPFDFSYKGFAPQLSSIFQVTTIGVAFYRFLCSKKKGDLYEFFLDVYSVVDEVTEFTIHQFFGIVEMYIGQNSLKPIVTDDVLLPYEKFDQCSTSKWALRISPRRMLDEISEPLYEQFQDFWSEFILTKDGFILMGVNHKNPFVITIKPERTLATKLGWRFEYHDTLVELAENFLEPEKISQRLLNPTIMRADYQLFMVIVFSAKQYDSYIPIKSFQHLKKKPMKQKEGIGLLLGRLLFIYENGSCIPFLIPRFTDTLYRYDLLQFTSLPKIDDDLRLKVSTLLYKWNLSTSTDYTSLDFVEQFLTTINSKTLESIIYLKDIMIRINYNEAKLTDLSHYYGFKPNLCRDILNPAMFKVANGKFEIALYKTVWIIDILHGRKFESPSNISFKFEYAYQNSSRSDLTSSVTITGNPYWNVRFVSEVLKDYDFYVQVYQKKAFLGTIVLLHKDHERQVPIETWYSLDNTDGEILIRSSCILSDQGRKKFIQEQVTIDHYDMVPLLGFPTEMLFNLMEGHSKGDMEKEIDAFVTILITNPKSDKIGLFTNLVRLILQNSTSTMSLFDSNNFFPSVFVRTMMDKYGGSFYHNFGMEILSKIKKLPFITKMTNRDDLTSKEIQLFHEIVSGLFDGIIESLSGLPVEMQRIYSVLVSETEEKSPLSLRSSIGPLIIMRHLMPAFKGTDPVNKKNILQCLVVLEKIVIHIIEGQPFTKEDSYLIPLNFQMKELMRKTDSIFAKLPRAICNDQFSTVQIPSDERLWAYYIMHVSLFNNGAIMLNREKKKSQIIQEERVADYMRFEAFLKMLGRPPVLDIDLYKLLFTSVEMQNQLEVQALRKNIEIYGL